MCVISTTTAAVVAAVLAVATAATSTAIAVKENSVQKKVAEYNAKEARKQAENAEMEAAYERQQGVEEARKQKITAILSMADAKAKLAGGNIAMSSGTVLNLENDAKINSELDALTTQRNSEAKAQSYMDKSNGLYRSSFLTSYNARVNSNNARLKLGVSSINTVGSIYTGLGS